jgi:uncharacterized membrane protein YeiH
MSESFVLPAVFDYTAILLMAFTGAVAGRRRGYDIVGMFALALVTGMGGALLRDGLFLARVPTLLSDPNYLLATVVATAVAFFGRRLADLFQPLYLTVDALALGTYAVVGAQKALEAHIAPAGAVLVGVVNAVGGGILRDVLVNEEPLIFKPGEWYALIAAIGTGAFVVLELAIAPLRGTVAALLSIGLIVALRLLAIRGRWVSKAPK